MHSDLYRKFDDKTVFITGATGFIGGRLVELLAENSTAKIKVLVRDYGKAMRIGRYPITYIKGDVNDETIVKEALLNCDIVLHCAYGNKGDTQNRNKVNIEGTNNLLQGSLSAGVSSLVFLSTMSVYGVYKDGVLKEESNAVPNPNDPYATSKYVAEKAVISFARDNNFHATVLQPTAVYGPWSPSYVMRPISTMQNFKFPLLEGGNGICNAVYVDDLCQAIFLAAMNPVSSGQKYLINGKEHFTWKDYYHSIGKLVPGAEFVSVSKEEMAAYYKQTSKKKKTFWQIITSVFILNTQALKELLQYKFFFWLANNVVKKMPASFIRRLKPSPAPVSQVVSSKAMMPFDAYYVEFSTSTCKVDATKAKRELNYEPQFGRQEGFEKIEEWVKWFYN